MWLFFDGGFVSIVEDTSDERKLLVRSRAKADLVVFLALCKAHTKIVKTPERDYLFRVSLSRELVAVGVGQVVSKIDYPNFKDRVRRSQGVERAHIYGHVWRDGLQIDDRRRKA